MIFFLLFNGGLNVCCFGFELISCGVYVSVLTHLVIKILKRKIFVQEKQQGERERETHESGENSTCSIDGSFQYVSVCNFFLHYYSNVRCDVIWCDVCAGLCSKEQIERVKKRIAKSIQKSDGDREEEQVCVLETHQSIFSD